MSAKKRIGLLLTDSHGDLMCWADPQPFDAGYVRTRTGGTPRAWVLEDYTTEPYVEPKPTVSDEALVAMVGAVRPGWSDGKPLLRERSSCPGLSIALDALDLTVAQRALAEKAWREG